MDPEPSYSSRELPVKKNPRENANPFSILFFGYTLPLFRKGMHKEITEDDLYDTLQSDKSKFLGDKLEEKWNEQLKRKKPSLYRALGKLFAKRFFFYIFVLTFLEMLRIVQPLALYFIIVHFYQGQKIYSEQRVLMFGLILVSASIVYVLTVHWYIMGLQHIGMRIRIACCSLVYRKCLRLSEKAMNDSEIEHLIALLAHDVTRFDHVCVHLPILFVLPFEFAAVLFIIYILLGFMPFAGVAVIFLMLPLQVYTQKLFSVMRFKASLHNHERVRLMTEIITGIKTIKMYTWERYFKKLITSARKIEVKYIQSSCFIKALNMSCSIFITRVAILIAIKAYLIYGNLPTPAFVFVMVAFYGILKQSLGISFPVCISDLSEASNSLKRIQKFLLLEEVCAERFINTASMSMANMSDEFGSIRLEEATGSWSATQENNLQDISLYVKPGELIGVIGPLGGGKSSLMHLILREMPLKVGYVHVVGVISYASQDPWLFGGTIQQNILFGNAYDQNRYKTVVDVCALRREFSMFPYGDETLVGDRGMTLNAGQKARINLARAIYKEADIYLLDDPFSTIDAHVSQQIFEDCINGFLKGKTTILITHQTQFLKSISRILMFDNGKIEFEGNFDELYKVVPDIARFVRHIEDEDEKPPLEKLIAEERRMSLAVTPSQFHTSKEKRSRGKFKKRMYMEYLKAGGSEFGILWVVLLFVITQLLVSSSDYFIAYWINVQEFYVTTYEEGTAEMLDSCELIYTIIVGSCVIATIIRSIVFFGFCVRASIVLHNNMFNKILFAPMCFFYQNPSGRILNRFSKDLSNIDEVFPFVTLETMQIAFQVVGISVVISITNVYLLIPIAVMLVLFYFLRNIYLNTSREVKRIEIVTKTPVFAHITASIQGLTTIRAYGAQECLTEEFDNYLDTYSSAFHTSISSSRAFGFWLDCICVVYITLVTFSFIITHEKFAANVGLAITQSLLLTGMLQWGMRQWSEMENNMASVERVVEYTEIYEEFAALDEISPPPHWPMAGKIEYKEVSMKYSFDEPFVLKDLSFVVKPCQKVGIVGRTGAGKSSIIASLFQLTMTDGNIFIDGVDTRTVSLYELRSKISLIPQEPVLFTGTLRKNLDPFEAYKDEVLWKALEDVGLREIVKKFPLGLLHKVRLGGFGTFTMSQRQRICLARAIIENNKILVLDEGPMTTVDPKTDVFIYNLLKEKFAYCTVLIVGHRLHTILESDKILVMEFGQCKEFDHPHVLLQNPDGIFFSMVRQAGSFAAGMLDIAETHYKKLKDKKTSDD